MNIIIQNLSIQNHHIYIMKNKIKKYSLTKFIQYGIGGQIGLLLIKLVEKNGHIMLNMEMEINLLTKKCKFYMIFIRKTQQEKNGKKEIY